MPKSIIFQLIARFPTDWLDWWDRRYHTSTTCPDFDSPLCKRLGWRKMKILVVEVRCSGEPVASCDLFQVWMIEKNEKYLPASNQFKMNIPMWVTRGTAASASPESKACRTSSSAICCKGTNSFSARWRIRSRRFWISDWAGFGKCEWSNFPGKRMKSSSIVVCISTPQFLSEHRQNLMVFLELKFLNWKL